MTDRNPPGPDDDQDLIAATLPLIGRIHTRVSNGLIEMSGETSVNDLVKSIFDGALHAHDRARTQDWPKLETQLESIAVDTVLALVLLNRRHAGAT